MTTRTVAATPLVLSKELPLHFIGIGGIGMSGLAKILLELGFTVSGSDARDCTMLRELKALGADVHVGHQAENVPHQAAVILSTAISDENPEFAISSQRGLPIYHRSDLLKAIFQGDYFIQQGMHQAAVGVSGTHGKTTITGMTGLALQAAGMNPTIIAGGLLPGLGTNAVLGKNSKVVVAELDESDGTIVQYTPTHSVIANLELDHADHYQNGLEGVIETFNTYLNGLKPESKVFFNVGCPVTKALYESAPSHIVPILIAAGDVFGPTESRTTYWLKNVRMFHRGCYQGYVYKKSRMLGELNLTVPGQHNLFNALAAIAMGDQLGADFEEMAKALHGFGGMGRRFERIGTLKGAWLIDDYAHHPTEISVTLRAARESLHGAQGKVIALFQPHRYSRLKALWEEFRGCFTDADEVYITDVYAASEEPMAGISAEAFCKTVQESNAHPNCHYLPKAEWEAWKTQLAARVSPQDIVLSMGAGDITQLFRNWEAVNTAPGTP